MSSLKEQLKQLSQELNSRRADKEAAAELADRPMRELREKAEKEFRSRFDMLDAFAVEYVEPILDTVPELVDRHFGWKRRTDFKYRTGEERWERVEKHYFKKLENGRRLLETTPIRDKEAQALKESKFELWCELSTSNTKSGNQMMIGYIVSDTGKSAIASGGTSYLITNESNISILPRITEDNWNRAALVALKKVINSESYHYYIPYRENTIDL